MATNANAENAVKIENINNEKSITISDPVKVTITVVQGTGDDKGARQTSDSSSVAETISDLVHAAKSVASTADQSITINDPVKVTITVVQATSEGKPHRQAPATSAKETINDTTKVEKAETSTIKQPSTVADPSTVSTSTIKSTIADLVTPATSAIKSAVTDPSTVSTSSIKSTIADLVTPATSAIKSADTDPLTVSTSSIKSTIADLVTPATSAIKSAVADPVAISTSKIQSTIVDPVTVSISEIKTTVTDPVTVSTSEIQSTSALTVQDVPARSPTSIAGDKPKDQPETGLEKNESTSTITSTAPTVKEHAKSEGTTTATTSTEDSKDSAPVLRSSAPVTAENKATGETETKAETVTEEKKEPTPASTSHIANANDTTTTKTTTDVTTEKKTESAPVVVSSATTSENNKQVEKTTTAGATTKKEDSAVVDDDFQKEKLTLSSSSSSELNKGDGTNKKDSAPSQAISSDPKVYNTIATLAHSYSTKTDAKENTNSFPITKDNAQHLTDFQRKKAEYFFNINLDNENKKFLTWEDVEKYLLFHVAIAGKEGAAGGDLEARLSRTARAVWEDIFDKIPSSDSQRNKLSLEQFLDTWASLIDYIVKNGQLPTLVQDLVNIAFELYSSKNADGITSSISLTAFEELFQKMNLGRPYALMAHKFLTENNTKVLDADKINSIVRAAITSSDDGHHSHFILPGFFKTITNKSNEKQTTNSTPSPTQGRKQPDNSGQQTPTPTPPPSSTSTSTQPQPPSPSQTSQIDKTDITPTPSRQQVPISPSISQQPTTQPSTPQPPAAPPSPQRQPVAPPPPERQPVAPQPPERQPVAPSHPERQPVAPPPPQQQPVAPPSPQQQPVAPPSPPQQSGGSQQLDNDIRNLLRLYHIDDGAFVEIADGPAKRFVLVHPERPLPPYILQDQSLVQQLQNSNDTWSTPLPSDQYTNNNLTDNQSTTNDNLSAEETKAKVTLEERVSRGEAHVGPTVPARQEQHANVPTSTGIRQVFPPASENQGPANHSSLTSSVQEELKKSTNSESNAAQEKKVITAEDEEKIIETILKQLTPLVEVLVANEVRRVRAGDTDETNEHDFIPFPFMFSSSQRDPSTQGQQTTHSNKTSFEGMPGGPAFIPPELLMTMMSDLSRGNLRGDASGFSASGPRPPPTGAPTGVEGFMMFVDGNPMMGGQPRAGPRY